MNILVTGGAGYIGSHTCKALALAGYTPVSYDNLVNGHRWAVKWGPLEEGDISDRDRLNAVIAKYQPAAVMHFAAYAYVGESVKDPGKYYRNNVAGTLNLLEAMCDHNIDKLIFSSTCATYGIPKKMPVCEEHTQQPVNPYGASKLMIERILQDFGVAYGLKSISLRYFNAAGADLDGNIGEVHEPETHLIPLIFDAVAGRRQSIVVFGDDYDTPDGTCVRDYIHVADLAEAHVLALEALKGGAQTTAYNLGNGNGFSVKQVIEAAGEVSGKIVPVVMGQRRLGDPAILIGDSKRIRTELGWVPRHPELKLMIDSAWQWYVQKPKYN